MKGKYRIEVHPVSAMTRIWIDDELITNATFVGLAIGMDGTNEITLRLYPESVDIETAENVTLIPARVSE